MELIRRQLEREIEISRYDLAGYSLGATHAAFVARLDDQRRAFGFERVLLINPPVNLARAAQVLDAAVRRALPLDRRLQRPVQPADAAVLAVLRAEPSRSLFSDELVYEIYRRQPPPDSTLEALIGARSA